MQWLALWKSYTHYRHDSTVWSNNWKDFVVADDTSSGFDYGYIGVGRTNGSNDNTWVRVNPEHGAVLHYQFSLYEYIIHYNNHRYDHYNLRHLRSEHLLLHIYHYKTIYSYIYGLH